MKALLLTTSVFFAFGTLASIAETNSLDADAQALADLFHEPEPDSSDALLNYIDEIFKTPEDQGNGLTFGGIAQGEYRNAGGAGDFAVGAKGDLSYGFNVGDGILGVRLHIRAEIYDGGENINVDPQAFYAWGDNKITAGYVRSSFDYVVKPFHWTPSYVRGFEAPFQLGVRYDTLLNENTRISLSYNDSGDIGVGAKIRLNENIFAYGAAQYNPSINYLQSAVGVVGNQGDIGYRLGWSCFGGGTEWLEAEVKYDFSDKITGIGYVGARLNGSTDMYYALTGEYHLNNQVDLIAGYEISPYQNTLTIGARFRFGSGATPYKSVGVENIDPWAGR